MSIKNIDSVWMLGKMKKALEEMSCGNFNSASERIRHTIEIIEADDNQYIARELTDDQVIEFMDASCNYQYTSDFIEFARAVIAADRELRK